MAIPLDESLVGNSVGWPRRVCVELLKLKVPPENRNIINKNKIMLVTTRKFVITCTAYNLESTKLN